MKIVNDTTLRNFPAWSGAIDTKERIIDAGKDEEFEQFIEVSYPGGLTDTELNDMLWFESEWIFEMLGITDDDDDSHEED